MVTADELMRLFADPASIDAAIASAERAEDAAWNQHVRPHEERTRALRAIKTAIAKSKAIVSKRITKPDRERSLDEKEIEVRQWAMDLLAKPVKPAEQKRASLLDLVRAFLAANGPSTPLQVTRGLKAAEESVRGVLIEGGFFCDKRAGTYSVHHPV